MSAASTEAPSYRCTVCDARWSYRAVRHVACCRDCGSGLRRVASSDPAPAVSAPGVGVADDVPRNVGVT